MPLPNPIGEPLEEQESFVPRIAPNSPSILPGIPTNKPLSYQTDEPLTRSEKPNLIETTSQPKDELSRAEADAFIINKASDIKSIPIATTSSTKTNSTLRDATSEVDPLIGKLDSDVGDALTNPNRIASNNSTDDLSKSGTNAPTINSSTSTSELNKTTGATTAIPDQLRENPTASPTASPKLETENNSTLPVVTASTAKEKAESKTPLSATAETSSKPEDRKTPLPSATILKTELSPNQTSPATTLTTDKSELNKTLPVTISTSAQSESNQISSTTASTSDKSEFNKTSPATVLTTDITEPNKTSPATVLTTDITEPNKTSPTITSISDKSESNKTLPATTLISTNSSANKTAPTTAETSDKSEPDKTSPATTSTTNNLESNKTLPATASTSDRVESNKISPATVLNTDKSEANQPLPAAVFKTDKSEANQLLPVTASTVENAQPNKTSPATVSTTDKSEANKPSPTITSITDKLETNKTLPTTASTTDKSEPSKTLPDPTSTTDKIEPNKVSLTVTSTTTSTTDKSESNKTSPITASTSDKSEPNKTSPTAATSTANNLDTATNLESNQTSTPATSINFDSNAFLVDKKGIVGIEFTSDGGWYTGQLAIVSLLGMEKFIPGSEAFISEAARRALSNSTKGYIAISDDLESAYYTDTNSSENFNSGQYLGTKTFAMTPGDKFFFMLVPNGTVQQVYDNPAIGGDKKPLFSIATDNPSDGFSIGQIADITGEGKLFVMEDMGLRQGSDRDYNDIIFKITGATSKIAPLSQFIDEERQKSYSQFVQNLINSAPIESLKTDSIITEFNSNLPPKTGSIITDSETTRTPKTDSIIAEDETTKTPQLELTTTVELNQPKTEPTVDNQESKSPKTESPTTVSVGKSDPQPTVNNSPLSELPPTAAIVDTSVSPNISSNDNTTNQKSPTVPVDKATNPETLSKTAVASDKIELDRLSPTVTTDHQINPEIPAKTAVNSEELASEQLSQNPATVPTGNSNSELDVTAQPLTITTNASLEIDRSPIKPVATISTAAPIKITEIPTTAAPIKIIEVSTTTVPITTEFPTTTVPITTDISTTAASEITEVPTTTAPIKITEIPTTAAPIKIIEVSTTTVPIKITEVSTTASAEITKVSTITAPIKTTELPTTTTVSAEITKLPTTTVAEITTAVETGEYSTIQVDLNLVEQLPQPTKTAASSLVEQAPPPRNLPLSLTKEPTQIIDSEAKNQNADAQPTANARLISNPLTNLSIAASANSQTPGTFTVGTTGLVKFDYTFDGGYYEGELAIFSLTGMELLTPGSPEFIAEAARRVLTNSTDGHVVIRDSTEGAKFTGAMPGEGEWGSGEYQGIKTFNMTPGDTFAVMLVPSGTVQSSLQFSWLWDLFPELRPLFSIAGANPNNTSYVLPIADATGTGNTFALEDMSAANSDGDYNDLIFTIIGATGNAPPLSSVINPAKEWRNTPLGQELIEYANSLIPPSLPNDDIIRLVEGEIFANTYERTLQIPTSPSILNISLANLNFDTSDTKSIKDAFEIALVDSLGKSLVHTIYPGKNAFFNATEGQASQLAPGVTLNGTTISVNLSQIAPGTAATLQIRLVNNDSDKATQVGITSIAIQPSAAAIAPVIASPSEGASTNAPVNFARLQDVGSLLEAEYKQTSFNSSSKILYADLAVKNTGQYPVRGTVLVGINKISDPTVRLLDADGITPEGIPYYDISKLVIGGILKPGELTSTDTLKFYNPQGVQFSYDLVFLSQLNQIPEFKATPNTEALVGKSYVYSAIAVDADGDALTYSLLEKPLGMEINSQTGKISWNPVAGDIGNHAVTVQVVDGKGGVAKQKYALSAINPPPNRPPIFTSTPVVDAWLKQPYTYDSHGVDPDSDTVSYNLIVGPEGMKVNPSTGLVEWTPPAVLVLGDTVLGKISLPGESDEFTFSGTAGGRIYIDPLQYSGAAGNWKFDIISPSGQNVSTGDLNSNKILNLTETGNYRIVTSATGDTTGSYGFSVIDLALVPAVPFDTTIRGTLSPGSEDDVFRFTGSKGQKLFFDKLSNSGSLDWVLYTADNKTPIYNNFDDMELYLPSDGEYLLALRGKSSFTSTVDYSFEIITPEEITLPIVLGSNATPNSIYGTLKEKGEKDFYTFAGEPGQRIYFDRLFYKQDIANYYWPHTAKIISPGGITLPIRNLEYGDDGDPIVLKERGTYRIEIDGTEENTGSYSFSILDLDSSTPISLDTNISGTLDPGQETHLYKFSGLKNQRLYFDTPGGTANTYWNLYDAGNNRIFADVSQNTDMEVVLPNSGTYMLAIEGYNGNTPVNYSFKVITPDVQSGTLAFNVPVSSSIGEKGEQDVYTFTGTKGQRVFLDTLMETPNNTATLVSPSGTKVIDGYSSLLYADYYWRNPVILPESGTYSLTVDGSGESTDSYSFRLIDVNAAPVLQKDALSPTSGTLNPGSSIQFYKFTGAKGDRVYFDSQENSPNTNWQLYNSNNERLAEVGLSSDFEQVLPGDGTYYLMLRGENSTPVNYKVQLVTTTSPPTLLTLNAVVASGISKLGEQDVYTFTGKVGQTLYFDPRIGNSNITVKINNPSGKEIWSGDTNSDRGPITLTEPGTYKLTVDGSNNTTGNYSFILKDKDTAPLLPLGSPINGSLGAKETVLYKVEGKAGQQLSFLSQNATPAPDSEWVLYAPQNLLTPESYYESNRVGGTNLNTNFTRTLPVDGTYTLALRNTSANPVNYKVQVNSTLPPSTPNSGLGVLHSGTLSVQRKVDDYSFTAASGTLVYFDGRGNDWTKRVRLYNQDNSIVFDNLDNQSDYGAYQLTLSGNYKLQAYGYYTDTTGSYSFQLVDLKAAPTLALNATTNVPLNPLETKAYKFTGQVGQKVWLDGLNSTSNNVTARLLNSSGLPIASTGDLQGDIALQTLEANGEYYLVLQSNNTSATTANFRLLDTTTSAINLTTLDNKTVSGNFGTSKRETLLYKFQGSENQTLYFDSKDGDWYNYYQLYSPDGKLLLSQYGVSDSEQKLPSSGEYVLAFLGNNQTNNNYSLQIITPTDVALPLVIGNPVNGEISKAGQQNTYTFRGIEGQRLWFDSLAGAGNIYGKLYSPTGVQLWEQGVGSDREPTTLKETGDYRFVVDGAADATGTFSFRFLDWATAAQPTSLDANIEGNFGISKRETNLYKFAGAEGQEVYFDRIEGNSYNSYYLYAPDGQRLLFQYIYSDSDLVKLPSSGEYTLVFSGNEQPDNNYKLRMVTPELVTQPPHTIGQSIQGEISEAGEYDTYTFTGSPGQNLWFDSLFASSNITAYLSSPTKKDIWSQNAGYDHQLTDLLTLNEAGIYTLKVDASGDSTGAYEFRLLDSTQANNTLLDSPIEGNFGTSKRSANAYNFTGNKGQPLYFDRADRTDYNDYYNSYYLYDSYGKRVFGQSLSSDYELSALPNDGKYTLIFAGNDRPNNNYSLKIVTPDLITTPYQIGDTASGTIGEAGEQDIYTFRGTIGQKLWFDSLENSSTNLTVKLVDPDGVTVFGEWYNGQYASYDREPVILTKEGNYKLIVDGLNDSAGNTYSFRLLDLAAGKPFTWDTSISGNFGSSKRETQVYKFQGTEGNYLYFDLTAGDPYNYYYLYSPDGKRLNYQGLTSDYELALPVTGEYALVLSGQDRPNNNYEFKVVRPELTAVPLTLGKTVSQSIDKAGEKDTYTFDGKVGQKLFFDGLTGNSNLSVQLYDPFGNAVIGTSGYSSVNTSADWLPQTLNANGTYRLVVDGSNNNTGNYSFTLSDLAKVTPLNLAAPNTGTAEIGEVDLYQITGRQGQVLNFDLNAATWSGGNWVLYGPDSKVIASPPWNSPDFNVALPTAGLYTLAVTGNNSSPVSYSFSAKDVTPARITNTGLNSTISGSLTTEERSKNYVFTASAGTQIFLDSINNNNNWQIRARLIADDGSTVFDNEDTSYNTQPKVLPQTGKYTLQIYGYYPSSTGSYQLRVAELPNSLRSPITNYLEIGSPVSGTLSGAEAKVYTFDGVEGLRVAFNGMVGTNVSATLYDPTGKAVFTKPNFQYTDVEPLTLTQNGLYQLVIEGQQATNQNYSFQLLELSSASEMPFNLPIAGSLSNGQQSKFYKFSGTKGDRLFVDSIVGNSSNLWKLIGPDNKLVPGGNNWLGNDLEVELPATGEYALLIEGGTSSAPVNYQFRALRYEKTAADIVTPGTGETGSNTGGSTGLYPVKLEASDGRGGKDIQEYSIRVWPDPTNSNPVIVSEPVVRFGLDEKIYRYQLKAVDPDGDRLKYRLVDAPLGALIDGDSGELLWFPENVLPGSKADFTVEVADPRGGKGLQKFTVDAYGALGKIQGAVFDDLNGNGFRDSKLVKGNNPAIVMAIDVSGSTAAPFDGPLGVDDVLKAQVAATLTLIDTLIAQGLGDRVNIGLIPHKESAAIQDMDPTTPGVQPYTTPLADKNNNGIPDIREILASSTYTVPNGHNDFTKAVQAIDLLVPLMPGDKNIIFMSDGYGALDATVAANVGADLKTKGIGLTAFGIGKYSTLDTIKKLDPEAVILTDIDQLSSVFGGFDPRYTIEPLMENVPVYLDINNNGILDPNEPKQLTKKDDSESSLGKTNYQFTFDNLVPGTYKVRTVAPSGYTQTAPSTSVFTDTVTTAGQTFTHLFGVHKGSQERPNSDPTFLTAAPTTKLKAGESLVYRALASDPDADEVTYGLVLNPDGMSVDPKNGTVVWTPTATQVEAYYKELRATRDRLIAFGRGDFAPSTVKFNVVLRASDGKGGQALQYVEVELIPPNNPPVFTSAAPSNLQPQAGKRFEYRAVAEDADGDNITYTILPGAPQGAAINATTGLVTWTPTATQLGTNSFTVKASDGKGGEAKLEVPLRVIEAIPNRPPDITSSPRTVARTGNGYFYKLAATDPDGNPITFTLVSKPVGMTVDAEGLVSWIPTASQTGPIAVSVLASDGFGGSDTQSWTVNVSNSAVNRPPSITSVPDTVTNLERVYRYQLTATDPEGDYLLWSLDNAPKGMVIDAKTGSLSWQPTSEQIGEQTIAVRVTDALGSYVGQEFSLKVTGINTPPAIVSVPVTVAGVGGTYKYQVIGTDPENDALRYSLGTKPSGMKIDQKTGLIEWTPAANAVGSLEVEVLATDTQGAVGNQRFAVSVGTAAINGPPTVVSSPVFAASLGSPYSYTVQATDPDGNALTYQLLKAPMGMAINPATGLLTWDNPTAGNHQIVVGAIDTGGLGAAQGFTLTARANSTPVIPTVPAQQSVAMGATYRYDLKATDAEGDLLSYSLLQSPTGMTVDEFGRISWVPKANDVGTTKPVQIAVTDTFGKTVTVSYNLSVVADTIAPKVNIVASKDTANLGDSVIFTVNAVDNVKVESLGLTINGTPVVIDAQGKATVKLNNLTPITAIATAKDAAGNVGNATQVVRAIDTTDVNAPIINISLADDVDVSAPLVIRGTITDSNLDYYTLSVAPVGSSQIPIGGGQSPGNGGGFKEVYRGTTAVNNGVIATFDPTVLANGAYTLKFTAFDTNGNGSTTERTVNVAGDLKLGNFRLSFTDLSVPVAGIPINVTRTYDSLNANSSDDFGYGWRMEFRDTDLKTSLKADPTYEELGINTVPFDSKTKVFITLPGGKRETFTFKPTPHHLNQYLGGAGPGAMMFKPAFESQKGSTMTLTVKDANLVRNENGYYGVNAQPFNPENPAFGGVYVLTTKEGLVYEIDAKSGDLLTATDANGNKLSFSDAGIKSSTGKSVTFERDVAGRIVGVVDPDGKKVKYEYDAKGDLVAVKDRENNTTSFKYEAANNPHFLTEVIDSLGRTGTKAEYDQVTGRLKQMVDVNGKAVEMTYDPNTSKQIVKDTRGYSTTYFYDTRGNVLQEIDAKAGTITRTYDSDNNLLSETDADGVTALYTYDGNNNLLTIKDKQGNTTRMTYDNRGRATSVVSPTGLKTSAKYDSRGNLIESIDTNGLKTTYSYNAQGQLRFQTAPDGQITELDYDRFGNINRMVDSRGNEVKTDYDLNNRIKKATTTFNVNGQTYTQWMEYDYDSEGKTIASRTSQGNTQSMIYDKLGRVTSMTDVFGNTSSYRYNLPTTSGQNNNLTPLLVGSVVTRIDEITLPDNTPSNSSDNPKVIKKYDQANNLIAEVSTTGLETRYTYDELGRLAETILPDSTPLTWDDNKRVKTEYSAASRIKTQTDIYANQSAYFYNDIGQLIRSKDVLGNDTTYTYNQGGQVESVTDFKNRTTRYVYDDKARIQETIYFDNSRLSLTYDSQGRLKTETNELNQTTTYEYDAYSQIKAVINALNERTEFEYDKRRNLIRVTDALGRSIRYKYDEYGQKVETTFHNGDKILMGYDQFGRITSVTDENLHSTKYVYDNLSQLTEIEQANQAKTKYTYDNLARLTETKDANQNITKFEYDDWFRPTATILPMGQRNQTVYDKFGQVVSKTDFNGDKINYTYDTLGRLDKKTFTDPIISPVSYTYDPVTSQLRTVTDGRGATQYAYDSRDRLKTTTTPDLKTVGYGYDLLNNVTSLTTGAGTTTYGYDKLNRLDTVKEGNRTLADYDYDKVGNLIQTKFADSSVETRKYDTRDRLTELTTKNVTDTVFSGFNYTLDAVGNRKKVQEYNGRTVDYSYDALNRLTEEKIVDAVVGNRTMGYGYDLVGNRLTKTDTLSGSTTYSYDNNNRLNQTAEGSKLTNFTYDNNGSLKTRSSGTETVTYDWINDGENRLVGVNNGTSQSQFVYDAFGSRVAAINNGVKTNYLTAPIWGLPEVLMEYDANGAVKADYTQGVGLVRSRHDGREGFVHTDGLGSTRAITDNVGLVTDRSTYDAFGGLLNQTGTFGNSFQFAGEQRDSATGLDYLRARYYDPSLGRFISKDAFPGYLDDPMSQHDYQYAHANPVSNTDPSGYFTMGDVMGVIGVASQLAAIGGVSFGTGYIGGAAAGGASGEEVLGMFGEWGAGFANGVSSGYLTDVYESSTGTKIEPNHAMLYNAGNVAGIGVSFLTGMKAATWATTAMGPLKWVGIGLGAVDTAFDGYGAAIATNNLNQSYQNNGKFEIEDAWNLTAYVPFGLAAIKGIKGFLGADNALKSPTITKAGNCFVAGTEILTVDGIKNIEDIQVGDWVIADDPTTPGGIEAKQVLDTFIRETDALVDLYVDGEVISTTGEHPFWVADKGWVEAKDLVVGSLLQTGDGRVVDVDKIEKREGKFPVYNFKVEGFPTYFVSELGILVHNTCGKYPNLYPDDEYGFVKNHQIFNDGEKWRYKGFGGQNLSPSGSYIYVYQNNKVLISRRTAGHIDLAQGENVDFAGEVKFGRDKNKGELISWDNNSGHYRPNAADAPNVPLSLDKFAPVKLENLRQVE